MGMLMSFVPIRILKEAIILASCFNHHDDYKMYNLCPIFAEQNDN